MLQQLRQHRGYYITLAVAAVVVMVMNVLTTLKGDEYVYAMLPGDLQHHCRSLADYVRTMPTFYQTTNGRLADVVERLMASVVGKSVFNVLNTLVFILLIEGIFTLAVGRRRAMLPLAIILVLLLLAFPYPGETLMWMAGACNYLWSATLCIWLLCWLKYAPQRPRWWQFVAVFVLAFVAGGFNESTSMGCLLGLGIFFALNRKQLTPFRTVAMVGCALGLCMVLMSPALLLRLEGGNSVNMSLSMLQMVSRRVLSMGYMSLRFVTPLAVMALFVWQWHKQGWRFVRSQAGFCVMAGVLLAALALGMVIERPYTFMVTLSMTIVLKVAYDWLVSRPASSRALGTMLCLLVATVASGVALHKMSVYRNYDRQVHQHIKDGPAQCVIEASSAPVSSRWVLPDVYDNSQFVCAYRTFYAYYYGKDNVQFLPTDMLHRYQQGTLLSDAVPMQFASSDTAFTGTILVVPGKDYAFLPMPDGDVAINGQGRVYYTNIEQVWGEEVVRRRYYLGSYRDYMPIRPYLLVIDGKRYMVIGSAVNDQVTRIEMSRYDIVRKQWLNVNFQRIKQ